MPCEFQISNQGKEFQNAIMEHIGRIPGIELNQITAYRPSSNGQSERSHIVINSIIAKMVDKDQ